MEINLKTIFLIFLLLLISCGNDDEHLNFHHSSFVADLHDDTPLKILKGLDLGERNTVGQIDIPRMKEGGMDLIFFAIWMDSINYVDNDNAYKKANEIIDAVEAVEQKYPTKIRLIRSADEALSTVEDGMIAGTFGMEGGYAIENDLSKLEHFYSRGVRYFAPTWNHNTSWATAAKFESTDKSGYPLGLTEFGREVIKKCNELGIMIDLSHSGEKTVMDILETKEDPVIASHSSAWRLTPHYGNLKDSQLKAIAAGGGVIFVNFNSGFVDSTYKSRYDDLIEFHKREVDSIRAELEFEDRIGDLNEEIDILFKSELDKIRPPFATIIDHIDYIAKLVGVDHVGLGSDFDGVRSMPKEMDDVSDLPKITKALFDRGYSEEDLEMILGGNLLRVFKKVTG